MTLTLYRPFPAALVRAALAGAEHVIVLERAFAPGAGGVVSADVRVALAGLPMRVSTVVAGLGGRAVTKVSVPDCWRRRSGEIWPSSPSSTCAPI